MSEYLESKFVEDDVLLMNLGYKPELRRNFSPLQVFGIAFSIMSLIPSIGSTLGLAASGGGVGMTWGWFVPCVFIMSVGISLSEMGSAMPTSGGMYWWTYKFAPEKLKKPASFLCGYSNTLGLIGGMCSIDYGFATLLASIPTVATDLRFTPTKFQCYGIFVGCVLTQMGVAMFNSKIISRLQTVCIVLNAVLIGIICIALPIGVVRTPGRSLNSGSFVFGNTDNLSDWPYGWQFFLSWMTVVWTIGAFDSCIHMSEEASNAAVAVPMGIVMSIGACWIFGFLVMAVIAACINPDILSVVNTDIGNAMAQLILDSLGKKWTIAILVMMVIVQWLMGLSIMVAASRQTWAFSRDGALPFSNWIRVVNLRYGVPSRALVFDCTITIVIGMLVMIDSTAANALFSLAVSSNSLSWSIPIIFRFIFYREGDFKPGPFFLGHTLSRLNNGLSALYLVFVVCILSQFPATSSVTPQTMNYTCIINFAVWFGAMAYYAIDARKWFKGPQLTLEALDAIEGVSPTIDEAVVKMPKLVEESAASEASHGHKNGANIEETSI